MQQLTEREARIIEAYVNGVNVAYIKSVFGISNSELYKLLRSRRISTRRVRSRKLT